MEGIFLFLYFFTGILCYVFIIAYDAWGKWGWGGGGGGGVLRPHTYHVVMVLEMGYRYMRHKTNHTHKRACTRIHICIKTFF